MTTHSNYSLQNFSANNAKALTENSQPVLDFKYLQTDWTQVFHTVADLPIYTVYIDNK